MVIIPAANKAAFFAGGSYGRAFLVCRQKVASGWTAPATVPMEGGSLGFEWGVAESDLVLLVMNRRGLDRLLESEFTIGGAAEAAASPVRRSIEARTDAKMTAEILS